MKMKNMSQASAIVSIIFGILVIMFPELLSWLVGLYLIISGIFNLWG